MSNLTKRLSTIMGSAGAPDDSDSERELRNAILKSKQPPGLKGSLRSLSQRTLVPAGPNARRSVHEEIADLAFDVKDTSGGPPRLLCITVDAVILKDANTQEVVESHKFFQIKNFGVNQKAKVFDMVINEDATLETEDKIVERHYESAKAKQIFDTVTSYVKHVVINDDVAAEARQVSEERNMRVTVAQGRHGRLKPQHFFAYDVELKRDVKLSITDEGIVIRKVSASGTKLSHGEEFPYKDVKSFTQNRTDGLFKMTYHNGVKEVPASFKLDDYQKLYDTACAYVKFVAERKAKGHRGNRLSTRGSSRSMQRHSSRDQSNRALAPKSSKRRVKSSALSTQATDSTPTSATPTETATSTSANGSKPLKKSGKKKKGGAKVNEDGVVIEEASDSSESS